MNDRELLELAAKAAGIRVTRHGGVPYNTTGMHEAMNILAAPKWNPLADDGEALRLAVKLRLVVHVWDDESAVSAAKTLPDGDDPEDASEAWRSADSREFGGLDTAARYAIVSAAAEIGRAMT